MLVKNLRLIFSKQEGEKIFLQTENGAEIVLPDYLLEQHTDHKQAVYLSIDSKPLPVVEDSQKEVLNELLNNQD